MPWVSPATRCFLLQSGVRDPGGGGRAPALVGGEAALPLQPQDVPLPALPAGAHSAYAQQLQRMTALALAAFPELRLVQFDLGTRGVPIHSAPCAAYRFG